MTTGDSAVMRYTRRQSAVVARWGILSFAVVLPAMGGCMRPRSRPSPQLRVNVTSYLSRNLSFSSDNGSTRIAVVTATEPREPLLEAEVRRKIEILVREAGFGVEDVDSAEYILTVFFAIGSGQTYTGMLPVYRPGGTSTTYLHTNTGQWATGTTYHPGSTSYVPYSYTYFTRVLDLTLYERQRWLASKEEDFSEAIVWSATVASAGRSADLRSVIDYLLVVTFDYFGEDTGQRKGRSLFLNDWRVRQLREANRRPSDDKVKPAPTNESVEQEGE